MGRGHSIKVTLSAEELARLDELPARRAPPISALLREPTNAAEVASRDEALSILTSLARDGRVSAAITLERALREGENPVAEDELSKFDAT
jgi:hypothetical protein